MPLALCTLCLTACAQAARPAGHTRVEPAADGSAAERGKFLTTPDQSGTGDAPAHSSRTIAPTPSPSSSTKIVPEGPGSWSFGTGPLRLEAASASGSWIAYCTAPVESDAPTLDARGNAVGPLRLVLATPRGERSIEALLASDPSGRWLVTLEASEAQPAPGAPVLVDSRTERRFSLAGLLPDLRSDGLPEHRSFAFSRSGTELFVLDTEGRGTLLNLAEDDPLAHSTRVTLPGDVPYRVESSADSFVILTVPAARTPAKWPSALTKSPSLRCRSRTLGAYAALSGPLPDPNIGFSLLGPREQRTTPLTAVAVPGFVQGFQGGWVRRTQEGELLLVSNGQQKRIASARCGARIIEADERSGWFLIACEEYRPVKPPPVKVKVARRPPPPKLRFPLYLARPGGLRDLELETMRTGTDTPSRSVERYAALHVDGRPVLVDFERGTKRLLAPTDRVLLAAESGALVRSGESLTFVGEAGSHALAERAPALSRVQLGASFVVFDAVAIQLAGGGISSSHLAASPLLVTGSGHALVPQKSETDGAWAVGPVAVQPITDGVAARATSLRNLDEELARSEADVQGS